MSACRNCADAVWVCENHPDRPWGGLSAHPEACECGAGAPCPCCNLELAAAGLVAERELAIADWLVTQHLGFTAERIRAGEHWPAIGAYGYREART